MTTLKPCPFCGDDKPYRFGSSVQSLETSPVACDNCEATANTAELWNTRHIPEITDEDVKRSVAAYATAIVNGEPPIRAALTAFMENKS